MSEFVTRWANWGGSAVGTDHQSACETSKRAFAASAGTQEGPSEHSPDLSYSPEYDLGPTESGRQKSGGARIQGMTLAEFATAGLVVEVNSEVLAGRIFFVSDNVPDSRLAGVRRPVYRAHELRRLAVLRPEPRTLRSLHEVKTIFDGVITDVTPENPEA